MKKCFIILVMLLCVSSAQAGYMLINLPPDPASSWMLITDGQGSIDSLILDSLKVHGDSNMSINSGWLGILAVADNSVFDVHGVYIRQAVTIDNGTIIFHAPAFRFEDDYVFRDFEDGTLKTQLLYGNFIFRTTPEPATIAILGIGGIFILKMSKK